MIVAAKIQYSISGKENQKKHRDKIHAACTGDAENLIGRLSILSAACVR